MDVLIAVSFQYLSLFYFTRWTATEFSMTAYYLYLANSHLSE